MRRAFWTISLLLLTLGAAAQQKNPEIEALLEENIFRMGVNTSPYEYLPAAETPVPRGFKPVYISHYGRHGSRSDWGGDLYPFIADAYARAAEEGLLTEEGIRAGQMVQEVVRQHNGMDGRLTARGAREHRAIAGRMYHKYRKVLRHANVRAISSVVPRCIVSMAAFTGELLSQDPKMNVSWDTGEAYMIYCSSVDPDDVRDEAYEIIYAHAARHMPDTNAFMARIFRNPDEGRARIASAAEMIDGTMAIAAISGAFDMDDFLLRLFSADERYWYAQNISLNLYLRQCNSIPFGDRRMAVPECDAIMHDIVDKADEALAGGPYAADLRFGHDYQLLATCSRLGIRGIAERMDENECLDWPGFLYTPFAGNLQIIFYRNRAGQVLVKFYINERETGLIGLEGGPYYKWEDVKNYWNNTTN